jgi:hypothetical protein
MPLLERRLGVRVDRALAPLALARAGGGVAACAAGLPPPEGLVSRPGNAARGPLLFSQPRIPCDACGQPLHPSVLGFHMQAAHPRVPQPPEPHYPPPANEPPPQLSVWWALLALVLVFLVYLLSGCTITHVHTYRPVVCVVKQTGLMQFEVRCEQEGAKP